MSGRVNVAADLWHGTYLHDWLLRPRPGMAVDETLCGPRAPSPTRLALCDLAAFVTVPLPRPRRGPSRGP